MPRNKPTGAIGPLQIPAGEDGTVFRRISFPPTKPEIEAFILDRALRALEGTRIDLYALHSPPRQNPENDFDFTLPTQTGEENLDLMEVAPLEGLRGYGDAPFSYNHGEMAEWVWTKLTQKAIHYGQPMPGNIHLLIYSTDLAFRLSSGVLEILAYSCYKVGRGFKTVCYFVPDDQESGEIAVLHPRPAPSFHGFSLRAHQERRSLIANFAKASVVGGGGAVDAPLGSGR